MKNFSILLIYFTIISCSTSVSKIDNSKILLTEEINKIYEQKKFNGFSVSIVDEKGTLYENGFGFSDIENNKKYTIKTIQNIGSVSKTFAGIALLKAQELGKLKLDDPIEKYLSFKVINPNFPESKITIRQLATHTSSIIDNEFYSSKNYYLKSNQNLDGLKMTFEDNQSFNPSDSLITLKTYLENVLTKDGEWNKNSFSANKPGTIYEYSNVATALAAFIIENATGQSYDQFTEKYILKPLMMNNSGWKLDDVDFTKFSRLSENPTTPLPYYQLVTYPDGGFITNINDLSKYLTELIKGYNGNGTILTKESYTEYFKPQLSASNFTERNTKNPYNESYNVGIFMGFGHSGFIGHTGGDPGIMSIMFFDPKTNIGRIMIFNTNFSDKAGNKAFFDIWNAMEKYQSKF